MSATPQQFWMVAGGGPTSARHESRAKADQEARRLARLNPDQPFFVMEAVQMVMRNDLTVISFRKNWADDGIPF